MIPKKVYLGVLYREGRDVEIVVCGNTVTAVSHSFPKIAH